MKRKIAAILAADVVGYSRMVAEDEEDTLARLCSYRAVFSDFIERFRGRIFNTAGDAILAEFESAVDAVRCAVDIQETLKARNLAYPPSRQMKFRVGITIGDVVERDGDLLGDGVNIAARLESLAPEGGICISRSVHEAVANKLSVEFSDKGKQNLKNIPEPVHAYTFASGVTSPKRMRAAHLPLRYWGGIAALSMLAVGIFGFMFSARQDSERSPEPPPVRETKGKPNVAAAEAASPSKVATTEAANSTPTKVLALDAASSPETAVTDAARSSKATSTGAASSSKAADTEAANSPKVAAADVGASSSEKTSAPPGSAHDQTESFGRASSDSDSKPSHEPNSDPVAWQAALKRRWNDCQANDNFEQTIRSCSALIDSKVYAGADLASVYLELGRAKRDNKQPNEAIEAYSEAIRLAPSAKGYNNRGIAYFDKGQWNMAIDDYTEAIRLDPLYGDAFNNRAWTKVKAGRAIVALEDANEAVRLLPTKGYALDTRAHVHEALGNRNAAIQDYRKALELTPDNKGSLLGLKRLGSAL